MDTDSNGNLIRPKSNITLYRGFKKPKTPIIRRPRRKLSAPTKKVLTLPPKYRRLIRPTPTLRFRQMWSSMLLRRNLSDQYRKLIGAKRNLVPKHIRNMSEWVSGAFDWKSTGNASAWAALDLEWKRRIGYDAPSLLAYYRIHFGLTKVEMARACNLTIAIYTRMEKLNLPVPNTLRPKLLHVFSFNMPPNTHLRVWDIVANIIKSSQGTDYEYQETTPIHHTDYGA